MLRIQKFLRGYNNSPRKISPKFAIILLTFCPLGMGIERKKIPESKVSDAPERMDRAWIKMTRTGQDKIYREMKEGALEELKEKIRRGEPLGEGIEHIVEYLRALDDYLFRGNI